jgi:hypothetical protein
MRVPSADGDQTAETPDVFEPWQYGHFHGAAENSSSEPAASKT